MKASTLKKRITELCSHVLFEYAGADCGIDPITANKFNMWFGSAVQTVDDIESVMTLPLFDGKSLTEIAKEIEIYE